MNYSEKLKDPRWQRKRLEIMQRDQFTCSRCFDSETTLHVHHRYYVKGRDPWEYPAFALTTICADCHNEQHAEPCESMDWESALNSILIDSIGDGPFYDIATQIERLRSHGFSLLDVLLKLSSMANELDEQKAGS